jgi:hypothetical protein
MSPAYRNTKRARQSMSLNSADFYHTDAGTHGMVAERMGITSSGSMNNINHEITPRRRARPINEE